MTESQTFVNNTIAEGDGINTSDGRGAYVDIRPTARTCLELGLSVVPVKSDGSKTPYGFWKWLQYERLYEENIAKAFPPGYGLALIGGAVSGNLEFLDFDSWDVWLAYEHVARASGYGELIDRMTGGYFERSPNGAHLPYRCEEIAGNQKLAQRADEKAIIETRGEGGYCIIAPSNGRVHETGKPYVLVSGSLATIPAITPQERNDLFILARTFNEIVEAPKTERRETQEPHQNGDRPGDVFNARATWNEVLEPPGWKRIYEHNGVTYWRRPGKERGISASTNYAGSGLFYCFSTSTEFDAERGYSKFSAYTLLKHGGDFTQAAEALLRAGYYPHTANGDTPPPETIWNEGERDEEEGIPFDLFGDARLMGEPDMPLSALPSVIADFAKDTAARMGCDPAMVALPALVVAAAAIHDRVQVQPKQLDTSWRESARLWAAVIHEPGQKHTPAQAAALAPLEEIETRWSIEDQARLEEYRIEEQIYKHEIETYTKRRAKGEAAALPTKPAKPRSRRILLKDATVEAISVIASENTGGLLAEFDEMSGWFGSFDVYRGKGAEKDRSLWLESYNGGPQLIDRISRGRVLVPNWSVCFTGGIQTSPLRRFAAKMPDDGLFQRFFFGFAKLSSEGEDRVPDAQVAAHYRESIHRLVRASFLLKEDEKMVFTFSAEAQQVRARVERTARNVMVLPTTSAAFRTHLSKWPGHFARLALTYHVINHVHEAFADMPCEIPEETAERVARLMIDYFLPNQARFYLEVVGQQENHEHARWLAGFILAHASTKISARDIGKAYRELRDDLPGIQDAMMILTLSGWVVPVDAEKRNGATKWEVNPKVHTLFVRRAEEEKNRRNAVKERIREAAQELRLDKDDSHVEL